MEMNRPIDLSLGLALQRAAPFLKEAHKIGGLELVEGWKKIFAEFDSQTEAGHKKNLFNVFAYSGCLEDWMAYKNKEPKHLIMFVRPTADTVAAGFSCYIHALGDAYHPGTHFTLAAHRLPTILRIGAVSIRTNFGTAVDITEAARLHWHAQNKPWKHESIVQIGLVSYFRYDASSMDAVALSELGFAALSQPFVSEPAPDVLTTTSSNESIDNVEEIVPAKLTTKEVFSANLERVKSTRAALTEAFRILTDLSKRGMVLKTNPTLMPSKGMGGFIALRTQLSDLNLAYGKIERLLMAKEKKAASKTKKVAA